MSGNPGAISPARRLLGGAAWITAGLVGTRLLALPANVMLAHLLTPEEFGAYFLALTTVRVGTQLSTYGLTQVMVRTVAESIALEQPGRAHNAVRAGALFGLLFAIAIAVVYLMSGASIARGFFSSEPLVGATAIVAAWIVSNAAQRLVVEALRGYQKMSWVAFLGGASSELVRLALLAGASVVFGSVSLVAGIAVVVTGAVTTASIGGVVLRRAQRRGGDAEPGLSRLGMLQASFTLLPAGLGSFLLTTADVWILGVATTPRDVAVYVAASRLVRLVPLGLAMVSGPISPLFAELIARRERSELASIAGLAALLAMAPALLMVGVFAAVGERVLTLVFGDPYAEGYRVLVILSLGGLINAVTGPTQQMLLMSAYDRLLSLTNALASAVGIVVAVALVSNYGISGVALGMTCGMILQFSIQLAAVRRILGVWPLPNAGTAQLIRDAVGRASRAVRIGN